MWVCVCVAFYDSKTGTFGNASSGSQDVKLFIVTFGQCTKLVCVGYKICAWNVNCKFSCWKETHFERVALSGRLKCGWFRKHEVVLCKSRTFLRNLHCTGMYVGSFSRCRIMLSDWDRIQSIGAKDSTKTYLFFLGLTLLFLALNIQFWGAHSVWRDARGRFCTKSTRCQLKQFFHQECLQWPESDTGTTQIWKSPQVLNFANMSPECFCFR